jgi:hypothetical protein
MTRHLEAVICTVLLTSLAHTAILNAAEPRVAPAPIPTQIATAKKVFIANRGGDDRSFEDPIFQGGPDRSYNQFYAAMKKTGNYELVGSPAEADLILEIQFLVPAATPAASRGTTLEAVPFDPQFRLMIRDPKTNAVLWGFTEHVEWAILQGNRDKNFDQAEDRIITDVQALTTRAAAVAGSVKP